MSYADIETEVSNDYLKLESGTVVVFHLLTKSPDKEVIHWENKKKTLCTGPGCEMCAKGNKQKKRWKAEVLDRKDGLVKKLEFGSMIANQFKGIAEMLRESGQSIHDVDIRIKTTGTLLETEYSVLHVPLAAPISKEMEEKYSLPF